MDGRTRHAPAVADALALTTRRGDPADGDNIPVVTDAYSVSGDVLTLRRPNQHDCISHGTHRHDAGAQERRRADVDLPTGGRPMKTAATIVVATLACCEMASFAQGKAIAPTERITSLDGLWIRDRPRGFCRGTSIDLTLPGASQNLAAAVEQSGLLIVIQPIQRP